MTTRQPSARKDTPGVYTSEFWLSVGAAVSGWLVALGFADAAESVRIIAGAVGGIVPIAYTAWRSLLKRG